MYNPADRVLLVVGAPITAASYDIIEQCIRTRTSANGNGLATALGGVLTKFLNLVPRCLHDNLEHSPPTVQLRHWQPW